MKARKSLLRITLLLVLCLSVCLSVSAAAEEEKELTLEDLGVDSVEEIDLEAPLISNPLPIDFSGGYPPQEQYYLDENTYRDPTISVEIIKKDVSDLQPYKGRTSTAWIVDIRIGHASQLRTAAAESFDKDTTLPIADIAKAVDAVVAFNSDYVTRQNEGCYILREGILFKDKLKGKRDVLLIDEDGDFHTVHLPKSGEVPETADGKKIINAFCFGPILVEDGEVVTIIKDFGYLKPDKYYARIALCQVGPLHYKVILTTHEQSYDLGLQLKTFAQLCKDEGAIIAYNLDGGESTTLLFRGERVNFQKKIDYRPHPDILYFASAWDGEAR